MYACPLLINQHLETYRGRDERAVGNVPITGGSSADFPNYRGIRRDLLCFSARFHFLYMQLRPCHSGHFLAEMKSRDAVYALASSVIMLNTDLHNPQVRVSQRSWS